MSNGITRSIFAFSLGAAVGAVVSWRVLKTKYEQIAQEEIDSMDEYYRRRSAKLKTIDEMHEMKDETFEQVLERYSSQQNERPPKKKGGDKIMNEPHVITPDEYGELDDYETISLSYYADGVLADELDCPIEDIERAIGQDSLTKFGEFEEDSVFVRNEELKIDYEILRDTRNYSDVVGG